MPRLANHVGRRFGRLVAVARVSTPGGAAYACRCDCGSSITVLGKNLVSGNTQSCRCLQYDRYVGKVSRNLVGDRFGELTVIDRIAQRNRKTRYACQCSCGDMTVVTASDLVGGNTKSCGHLRAAGETHWRWKGGHSKQVRPYAHTAWKRAVVARDGACRCCDATTSLTAHHLASWSKFPKFRYAVSNGVTLCRMCHAALHSHYHMPTEEDSLSFIADRRRIMRKVV